MRKLFYILFALGLSSVGLATEVAVVRGSVTEPEPMLLFRSVLINGTFTTISDRCLEVVKGEHAMRGMAYFKLSQNFDGVIHACRNAEVTLDITESSFCVRKIFEGYDAPLITGFRCLDQ